ncbi:serine hydrolase domain-containing protein [Cryobacterium sp. PH31-L1]|uniref:serine hydrolase domain-containing protein n=1 Tax=Cryobacterium sp. PH31-L1 TaxID=3046199 RepID=UPI0024B95B90|nr:serine hydrolase domain-containing protein [Cryobacterium sp. PH31-L1]MDJ0375937.1 serine hydrolase domain-containing protein [Cryobacterium sp. PH31-L1]
MSIQAHNDGDLPGFNRLVSVFAEQVDRAHGGQAFCVYRNGHPLVRLYGGSVEQRAETTDSVATGWGPDTLAVMFSGTKGVVATVAALLVDRGLLDVRRPVAHYWPEFAAAGKGDVTVAQVLSHTVGLVYVDPEPAGEFADLDNAANAAVLAAQTPLWQPGTRVAYHAITYGYLMNEIFLRVTGRSAGELIDELIGGALGLDIYLGLPLRLESRVTPMFRDEGYAISTHLTDPVRRKIVERMYAQTLLGTSLRANTLELHRAELAAGGGIATADGMAALYSRLAEGSLVSPVALAEATRTWSEGIDAVNDRPLRFGLGFELADPLGSYGPEISAFGHSGAGGSLNGAWPEHDLGFSFLTNEMLAENHDSRVKDLLAVLHGLL